MDDFRKELVVRALGENGGNRAAAAKAPDTQPDRSANSVLVSRGPKAVQATPGEERETFIREVAAVLNRKTEDIDLSLDLQTDYGCDELDVIECIQIAEDVRNVTIKANSAKRGALSERASGRRV